jgi:hypothetical protein
MLQQQQKLQKLLETSHLFSPKNKKLDKNSVNKKVEILIQATKL